MGRLARLFVLFAAALWAQAAAAEVQLSFHSFNGSVLFGRYPHTFVVLEGTLEETGAPVNENYGFTAKRASPAVLRGPVYHDILIEKPKYINSTNRHFTVPISDEEYWAIRREMEGWRDAPGKYYDLETRNCIHFVGTIAKLVGITVEYPDDMMRRPKKWLNHIAAINPDLGAPQID
ncbi:hypothetical protein [Qipengyuania atrilutea]|uniref:LRAT domain-containing protein n=1 Tax=Qipengyuania atrilutea TaxID=2744473 RepID=A0A850H2M0_9SPHN|nr:hypothetical protein [Actirhodobacter atriluteus]NVD44926.1 hypothetical protein [Actirhodobacter atriluteus]